MYKKTLSAIACFALVNSALIAQDWKVGGNALSATGRFGTTTKQNVQFITDNVVRMTLNKDGNLEFNSDKSSIQFPSPGANSKPMMFLYKSGDTNKARMVFAYSPEFKDFGLRYDGFNKFDFTDGFNTPLGIDVGLNKVGIGTLSPLSKLHVKSGNSGTTPFFQSVITAENSNNAYINLLAPSANETGILFGTAANNVSGGVVYNSSFQGSAPNALQFRTGGNFPRMVVTAGGNVGIATTNPEQFRLKIIHGNDIANDGGLAIENSTLPGTEWEFFAGGGNGPLNLLRNKAFMGQFQFPSGNYQALSDERLKTNIKPMDAVLEKIARLKPSTYKFKAAPNLQDYNGFIAQDVMKIFPSLVSHTVFKENNTDVYTMDYSGFGVIAIKGIQELMKINEEKDAKIENQQMQIDNLQKQIDELRKQLEQMRKSSGGETSGIFNRQTISGISSASLEQNTPNPFTGLTTINYTLPQKFTTAQIAITDKSGITLKRMNISGTGKGMVNVDASSLISGVYNYSLMVDGKLIETKQMILTK